VIRTYRKSSGISTELCRLADDYRHPKVDAVESIPGVGSVYTGFDRMSEVMLDGDARSFREVKLVEFPHAGVYSLAFQTASVPDATPPGADEEGMLVLFVPLAPNPVMGGFMVCVPEDQVHDVDMTVEEAFRAIVTSGVAMPDTPTPSSGEQWETSRAT
jgi:uncharacterized membrane protein